MRDQSEPLESCSIKRKQHTHRVCVCVRERAGRLPWSQNPKLHQVLQIERLNEAQIHNRT
ncbi:hypothetical protein HanIR_Chr17g0901941 [Helianthus annuus]|nr:hypothetical protein HanIR_Chr17g0901941 [Helianthus annuus]